MQLNGWLEEHRTMLCQLLGEAIELKLKLSPDLPAVVVDPLSLRQVMLVLAAAARQAMPEGGKFSLETGVGCLPEMACGAAAGRQSANHVAPTSVAGPSWRGVAPALPAAAPQGSVSTKHRGRAAGSNQREEHSVGVAGADWTQASQALPAALPQNPTAWVKLRLKDTSGARAEQLNTRIQNPCFCTAPPGSGISVGLATVADLVKNLGCIVQVGLQPEDSPSIDIYLPGTPSGPLASSAAVTTGATQTILLVDDEDEVRQTTKRVLSIHGYEVLETSCGREALALAEPADRTIDLLITDIQMPVMTGHELAARITTTRPKLPVLFLSGYTANALDSQELSVKSFGFLQKPFGAQALLEKVREALAR